MMIAAVLVVLTVPIVGLRLLPEDPEAVSATGDITLTPGKRMLYVVDGHVASMSLVETGIAARGAPVVSELLCARIAAAAGTGLCLRRTSPVAWSATVLDRHLEATATYPMPGKPALADVSPSGRTVAWTALEKGSSLNDSASAVTSIVDTTSGRHVEDLESFAARQGDRRLTGHQVWGVTFVDDTAFYATVSVGGKQYLARGDLAKRTLRVVASGIASPAVSPDRRSIAFVRAAGADRGRLALMNLRTGQVTGVADRRTVADQPVWLDPRTIAYVVRDDAGTRTIWAATLENDRLPELLVANAESPSGL